MKLEELHARLKACRLQVKNAPPQAGETTPPTSITNFHTYIYGRISDSGRYRFYINLTKANFTCDTLLIEGEEMPTQQLALHSLKEKINTFFEKVYADVTKYEEKLNENDNNN